MMIVTLEALPKACSSIVGSLAQTFQHAWYEQLVLNFTGSKGGCGRSLDNIVGKKAQSASSHSIIVSDHCHNDEACKS
jgi:hypothetical protein